MTEILLSRAELTNDSIIDVWETSSQGFKGRSFNTKEMSGKELSDLVYDFNIELNFFNNYNFRKGNYKNMLSKLHKIVERFQYHIVALLCRAKCYYYIGEIEKAKSDLQDMITLSETNSASRNMYERYSENIISVLDEIKI